MDNTRRLLRHYLAALAYRTQKALRDAPPSFAEFRAGDKVRTPHELVRHMTSVLGYARTFFTGGKYRPEPLPPSTRKCAAFTKCSRTSRATLRAVRRCKASPPSSCCRAHSRTR